MGRSFSVPQEWDTKGREGDGMGMIKGKERIFVTTYGRERERRKNERVNDDDLSDQRFTSLMGG